MEKAILVGLDLGNNRDFVHSMEELALLAEACDMEVVGEITQKANAIHNALYIGTGKVDQVAELAAELDADMVIFDSALSPMQLRNLSQIIDVPIMDRTTLILEIFSKRARTREARLQVDVASLQYMLPRLVGLHDALSRQGGGSGSMSNKGSGEKKLELDRRHIEQRLATLRRELKQVEHDRETQRKNRMKNAIPLVSLVGYTNAGKSALMNQILSKEQKALANPTEDKIQEIEGKKVFEQDMLFATLETTVRKVRRTDGKDFLLSDTVGFINELPTNLVKAFRSTLEEAKNADLLLQVVDFSDEHFKEHMEVTKKTLDELGAGQIPMLYIFNKMDRVKEMDPDVEYPQIVDDKVYIAAALDEGVDELLQKIEDILFGDRKEYTMLFPYDAGGALSNLRESTEIMTCEYLAEGTQVTAMLDAELAGRYRDYICD